MRRYKKNLIKIAFLDNYHYLCTKIRLKTGTNMERHFSIVALTLATILFVACGGGSSKEQKLNADRAMETAQRARNYNQLLVLADSFEHDGSLTPAKAYYWRGYASDRMRKLRMAEFYWKTSLQTASNSDDPEDVATYAHSATRLANLLTIRGEYENALKAAIPAAERLEALKCDTTSDYMNLLIYIGCCHMGIGNADKETTARFDQAYQKHLSNIEQNRNDESYKDAIAGLINIAYACITTKNYQQALKWTDRFGKLIGEYEQRPDINNTYTDKQLARYCIYKAIAHEHLGQSEEANKIYESFLQTEFSKTPEGRINANEYLMAANRWDEAAYNYRSLDAMFAGEDAFTIDNIKTYALKKYQTNLKAGRLDSALAVSRQICDSLEHAFNQAKRLDAEEQNVIINKVEQLTEQQAASARQKQLALFALLGLLFLCFVGYAFYRGHKGRQLHAAHKELKADFSELETRTADKERVMTEKRTALEAQKALLPTPLPQRNDIAVHASLFSGQAPSSDFYDYLIRDEQLFFCIGTAQGDTVQSSVQMAMTWAQFRTAAAITNAPSQILAAINGSFAATNGTTPAVDIFVGVLNFTTDQLNYSLAGTFSPLLLHNDTVHILPVEPTSPAGSSVDTTFHDLHAELAPDTMLLLYTTGAANITNADGKIYGEKRLRGAALQAMKLNPQPAPFLDILNKAQDEFIKGAPQATDRTILVIHRN